MPHATARDVAVVSAAASATASDAGCGTASVASAGTLTALRLATTNGLQRTGSLSRQALWRSQGKGGMKVKVFYR